MYRLYLLLSGCCYSPRLSHFPQRVIKIHIQTPHRSEHGLLQMGNKLQEWRHSLLAAAVSAHIQQSCSEMFEIFFLKKSKKKRQQINK